jgi:hypothetical protein
VVLLAYTVTWSMDRGVIACVVSVEGTAMAKAHSQTRSARRMIARLTKLLRTTPRHSIQYAELAMQLEVLVAQAAKYGRY